MVRDDSCACGHARPMMRALWKIVDARSAQLGLLWCVCVTGPFGCGCSFLSLTIMRHLTCQCTALNSSRHRSLLGGTRAKIL